MKTRYPLFVLALIVSVALVGAPAALSQNISATLRGTVRDGSGSVITGALVSVQNTGTGVTHSTTTNSSGDYVVVQLPPASYAVTVSARGFESSIFTGIVLNVAQEARVDAALKIGTVAQQVEVSSTAILLQTEDSVNGSVIDSQKLEELPSNSRNFWQEAQLDPNVSPTTSGDSLANRGGFIVAGITSANNNYLLDGSDDNDWTTGQPTVRPSLDAIQEFKIITGEAPAEFGRRNGGQVVLTTRSGTNNIHGGAFLSYRDGKWNAPQYNFTGGPVVAPAGTTKLFGGSFGGPIHKDKTFFFATYEGTRLSADPAVSGQTPFDAWKGGTYTSDGSAQFSSKIIDPTTGLAFPQNAAGLYEIPENRISSATKLLLQYFPEAASQTGTVGVFANHKPNTQDENQGTFRVDQVLGANDTLNGIYTLLDGFDAGTIGDLVVANSVVPGFGGQGGHIYQHASITELHTFSAKLFNELRVGFNRMDAGYGNQDASQGNVVGELGLPQGGNFMEPATYGNLGVPGINIAGLSSIGTSNNPQWRGDNTVQASDGLTFVHGNHTAKVGFDLLDFFKHSFFVSTGRGSFTFNGQYTGGKGNLQNEFADFLLGDIYSDTYGNGNENQYPIQHSGALFAQDEWKITPSLTLNYGLRWEYLGPVREAYNLINHFDLENNDIVTGQGQVYDLNNSTGLLQQTGTLPPYRDNYAAVYSDFAPRFGFAYRIHGAGDTVIRGGFGTYYGIPAIQTWNSANGLGAPFLLSKSFTGPTPSKATGITSNPYQWGPTAFGSAGTQTVNSISITTENPHIRSLYTDQYSLGIQHEFGKTALVEVSYQGSRTFHNVSSQNINIPTLQTRLVNPAPSVSVNSLRPYNTIGTDSEWSSISYLSDGYYSNYNSLLLRAERRFESGLTFQSYLVYAKSLEVSSLQNPDDFQSNYGPSAWDQKFRSVTSGVYNLPFGHGQRWLSSGSPLVDYTLGGWQASTVVTFQSGRPVSTSTTDSLASYTGASDRAFAVSGVSATAKTDGNTGLGTHTPQNWFNTAAYRSNDPANGTNYTSDAASGYVYNYGTAGFDSVRGPGLQDVDFGLIKHVKVNDHNSLEFRADAFNILNHPNFTNPSAAYGGSEGSGITPGTTAVITSTVNSTVPTATGGPRQLQLALRYSF
jgi:Carboxypeptidase regulatory-like domain